MTYKRVTAAERTLIHRWKQEGRGIRETARRLMRAASSISREIMRNTGFANYRPKRSGDGAGVASGAPAFHVGGAGGGRDSDQGGLDA